MNKKAAAVVILYNYSETELENIETYKKFVDHIILIDNSDSDEYYNRCEKHDIFRDSTYLCMNGNKGIATALNKGMEIAINKKYEWVLTMDQDSTFHENIVNIFFDEIEKLNINLDSVAILTPNYEFDRKRFKKYNGIKDLKYAMQSGNLVSLEKYRRVEPYKEDLFIDGVDYEYCFRVKRLGYRIIEVGNVVLKHQPAITHKFLFFKYGYCSPIRVYYQVRNLLYISSKYNSIKMRLITYYKLFKIIFLFDNKKEYLNMYRQARKDYKNNKYGKFKVIR